MYAWMHVCTYINQVRAFNTFFHTLLFVGTYERRQKKNREQWVLVEKEKCLLSTGSICQWWWLHLTESETCKKINWNWAMLRKNISEILFWENFNCSWIYLSSWSNLTWVKEKTVLFTLQPFPCYRYRSLFPEAFVRNWKIFNYFHVKNLCHKNIT